MQERVLSHYELKIELISAHLLPKAGEQRSVAEPHDKYCPPPTKLSSTSARAAAALESGTSTPFVVIEVHGGGRVGCIVSQETDAAFSSPREKTNERSKSKSTRWVSPLAADGLAPEWGSTIDCRVEKLDDAMLSFHVYDKAHGSELIAYEAIPMQALRAGFRAVRLRSPTGSKLSSGTLLVRLRTERSRGGGGGVWMLHQRGSR